MANLRTKIHRIFNQIIKNIGEGDIRESQRGVPYLTIKGQNLCYFNTKRSIRVFKKDGSKDCDFKSWEQVVEHFNRGTERLPPIFLNYQYQESMQAIIAAKYEEAIAFETNIALVYV